MQKPKRKLLDSILLGFSVAIIPSFIGTAVGFVISRPVRSSIVSNLIWNFELASKLSNVLPVPGGHTIEAFALVGCSFVIGLLGYGVVLSVLFVIVEIIKLRKHN